MYICNKYAYPWCVTKLFCFSINRFLCFCLLNSCPWQFGEAYINEIKHDSCRVINNECTEKDFILNSNMTWFFSPIKSTDTNSALFPDKSLLTVSQGTLSHSTGCNWFFFLRSAVPRIGSVVCFLGPLGDVGSLLE